MSNSIAAKSLADWLARIEAGHPTEIDLGLDRVGQVAGRLNLNFSQSKVITVAGTNGKGSSCSLLEAILQADGKSTGVYSSPHFIDYNERIRINGLNANDEVITDAFEAIDAVRGEISLTYFEYGTLAVDDSMRSILLMLTSLLSPVSLSTISTG
jgi:dihydrofolate synthase/folylpolyglutamate synthase